MQIALQEKLLPGTELSAKLDFAEEIGVYGLEVEGRGLPDRVAEYDRALAGRRIRVVSICGQDTFDWLDPDRAKRDASIAQTRRNLEVAGHFGAVGAIVPPIFGPPRLPDLSPLRDAITLEKELLAEIVKELAPFAHRHGTLLLLEPLNRYEQHLLAPSGGRHRDHSGRGRPARRRPDQRLLPHAYRGNQHAGHHSGVRYEVRGHTCMWPTTPACSRAPAISTGTRVYRRCGTSAMRAGWPMSAVSKATRARRSPAR